MKNNKPYSRLHYVLWVIAGSEISVLKKCPNDYNRHANIGLMIFVTSLFASMTAFIAGSTFAHHNLKGVIAFALLWAFLIFSLDRSMVNSIKKDPMDPSKSMWEYFWPRLVLAIILSFFMSIPLDHIVFEGQIKRKMDNENMKEWQKKRIELIQGYNLVGDSVELAKLEKTSEKLEAELNEGCNQCPFEDYKALTRQADYIDKKELPKLYNNKTNATNAYNYRLNYLIKAQTPFGEPPITKAQLTRDKTLEELDKDAYKAKRNWKAKDDSVWLLRKQAKTLCEQWKNEKKAEKEQIDAKKNAKEKQLALSKDTVAIQSEDKKRMMEETQGFDTQFVTLFLLPNWGVQILKWLIFLALLVIEILPTYLKLKTPVGQYDWEMYKREATTELETRAKIDGLKNELKDIEDYRVANEISLNKKIIDKVVAIEEKLANEMLVEWEIKARDQMKKNVENAD